MDQRNLGGTPHNSSAQKRKNNGRRKKIRTRLWILWSMTTMTMLLLVLLCSDRFQTWKHMASAAEGEPVMKPVDLTPAGEPPLTGFPGQSGTEPEETPGINPTEPAEVSPGIPATGTPATPSEGTPTPGTPTTDPAAPTPGTPIADPAAPTPGTPTEPAAPTPGTPTADPAVPTSGASQIDLSVPPGSRNDNPSALFPGIVGAKLPQPPKRNIDPDKPMLAFTFDDGPYRHNTETIVELFEKYDGRATFFVVGYHVESFGACMQYAYTHGFQIGNHTLSHNSLTKLTDEEAIQEIDSLNQRLNDLGIPGKVMLRPPYGAYSEHIKETVSVPMIGWNVDSEDWKSRDPQKIYEQIVGKVKDGDIILLHDLHDCTAESMRTILPALAAEGFQFVTVEEMFEARGITPENGQYYYNIPKEPAE